MQPADQQTVNQFLGVSATTDTMNGGQLSPPGSVTVSVLNGTGTYDEGITTANSLQQLGFDVVGTGDTPAVATQSETLVTYDQMTPSDEAAAQAVADSLSGAVTLAYGPTDNGTQVTVTTGSDFSVDAPPTIPPPTPAFTTPGATSPVTTPVSSTTTPPSTTTTTEPPNGAFSAPTSAVAPLAPWGPRSCTASGGEGP